MRYLVTVMMVLTVAVLLCPASTGRVLATSGHTAYAREILVVQAGILGWADAEAEEDKDLPEDPPEKLIRSKRERKIERRTNWIEGLKGDKARIYELYGYPSGKFREETMGTVIEKWVYPDHGVTFKFKGNNLIR